MKNYLLPHFYRLIGWILFVPSVILGALFLFWDLNLASETIQTIVNDLSIIGISLGSIFIVCSRERIEDEMTRAIRLSSLLNSLYAYVALLIVCTIAINGIAFLNFMIANLAIFPIIFLVVFKLNMNHYYQMNDNEE